jgi:hypothetical protein
MQFSALLARLHRSYRPAPSSFSFSRLRFSRSHLSRRHGLFRLAAAAVEFRLFSRIGDWDENARLQSSLDGLPGFNFHDSIPFKTTVKGISPFIASLIPEIVFLD